MKRPVPFIGVAVVAWLGCAAQAALGMPEGVTFCPVKLLTGHDCPGCGMGHAVVYAMRGEFARSFHSHPLGMPLLAVWTGWLLWKGAQAFGLASPWRSMRPQPLAPLK